MPRQPPSCPISPDLLGASTVPLLPAATVPGRAGAPAAWKDSKMMAAAALLVDEGAFPRLLVLSLCSVLCRVVIQMSEVCTSSYRSSLERSKSSPVGDDGQLWKCAIVPLLSQGLDGSASCRRGLCAPSRRVKGKRENEWSGEKKIKLLSDALSSCRAASSQSLGHILLSHSPWHTGWGSQLA